MNERIQELAIDAEDYADSIVDQGGEFHQAYTQKLAELIVRECAIWMDDEQNEAGDRIGDSFYWADRMKKHFGVEE